MNINEWHLLINILQYYEYIYNVSSANSWLSWRKTLTLCSDLRSRMGQNVPYNRQETLELSTLIPVTNTTRVLSTHKKIIRCRLYSQDSPMYPLRRKQICLCIKWVWNLNSKICMFGQSYENTAAIMYYSYWDTAFMRDAVGEIHSPVVFFPSECHSGDACCHHSLGRYNALCFMVCEVISSCQR